MFIVVDRQDGTGKTAVQVENIVTIDEVPEYVDTSANTTTAAYSVLTLKSGNIVTISSNFDQFIGNIHSYIVT